MKVFFLNFKEQLKKIKSRYQKQGHDESKLDTAVL